MFTKLPNDRYRIVFRPVTSADDARLPPDLGWYNLNGALANSLEIYKADARLVDGDIVATVEDITVASMLCLRFISLVVPGPAVDFDANAALKAAIDEAVARLAAAEAVASKVA